MLKFNTGGHEVQETVIEKSLQCTHWCWINLIVGMSPLDIVVHLRKVPITMLSFGKVESSWAYNFHEKEHFDVFFKDIFLSNTFSGSCCS